MKNLAITTAILVVLVGCVSAYSSCDNSLCTMGVPCSTVTWDQVATLNCDGFNRFWQILVKASGDLLDVDQNVILNARAVQFKAVDFRQGNGLSNWPVRLKAHMCDSNPISVVSVMSSKKNCYAYRTLESYQDVKQRDLGIHDMYEVVAFLGLVAQRLNKVGATDALNSFCYDHNVASLWGGDLEWASTANTNGFPNTLLSTTYDNPAIKLDFLLSLKDFFTGSSGSAVASALGLDQCLPINDALYH